MHERSFVLVPLCEIAPRLSHPITGRPFAAYLAELNCREAKAVGSSRSTCHSMKRIHTVAEMQAQSDAWRGAGLCVGLVPTMGFLHEGHLSLVDHSLEAADRTVVSIFVNPLQFGPKEDYAIYPRDMERDLDLLSRRGVDAVFHPQTVEFYPPDFSTFVEVEELTKGLCGDFRPGHFRGVTTVVTKLFTAVKPHLAVFGQKDYQQAAIIRRLVARFELGFARRGCSHRARNRRLGHELAQRPPQHRRATARIGSLRSAHNGPEKKSNRANARPVGSSPRCGRTSSAHSTRPLTTLLSHTQTRSKKWHISPARSSSPSPCACPTSG